MYILMSTVFSLICSILIYIFTHLHSTCRCKKNKNNVLPRGAAENATSICQKRKVWKVCQKKVLPVFLSAAISRCLVLVRAEGRRVSFGSLLALQVVPSEHVLQGETGHWDSLQHAFFLTPQPLLGQHHRGCWVWHKRVVLQHLK